MADGRRITLRAKILLLSLGLVLLLTIAAGHTLWRARQIENELKLLTEIYVPLDDQFAWLAVQSVERDLTYRHLLSVIEGQERKDPRSLLRALES